LFDAFLSSKRNLQKLSIAFRNGEGPRLSYATYQEKPIAAEAQAKRETQDMAIAVPRLRRG